MCRSKGYSIIEGVIRQSMDRPIKFASDCPPCDDCGEPFCEECEMHYADCRCLGPDSEIEEQTCLALATLYDQGFPTIPHVHEGEGRTGPA
jgi:hypothetical protein